jgi:lambda family phage portal protein
MAGASGEDFAALCATAVREVLVSGECFVRLRSRRPEDGLPVPLALELIDPARVPYDLTETRAEGVQIVQGIEHDALGRVTAYHVLDHTPGEPVPAGASAIPRRVPAPAMLHVYDAERPGQVRGVSALATALPRLRMLDAWGDAVLLRQQIANLFVGSLSNTSAVDADVSPLTGLAPSTTQGGRAVVDLVPGILQELAPGEELKFSDPPDPPSSQTFATEQARLACGAAGVPLQVVTGEWGATNDRLARVVLNQWRRRVERFRWSVIVPRLLRPVWSTWATLAGPRLLLGAEDSGATWRAHAWPYVHPVQDVAAQLQAVRGGLTSLSAVIAEGSGEDAETVLRQIAADNALADSLGLRLDSDSRQAKGGTK